LGQPGSGLVVAHDGFTGVHRAPIISAAAKNNVLAVYALVSFARDGGLLWRARAFVSVNGVLHQPDELRSLK
jgi:uncharacterized membrane protein